MSKLGIKDKYAFYKYTNKKDDKNDFGDKSCVYIHGIKREKKRQEKRQYKRQYKRQKDKRQKDKRQKDKRQNKRKMN